MISPLQIEDFVFFSFSRYGPYEIEESLWILLYLEFRFAQFFASQRIFSDWVEDLRSVEEF